MAADTYTASRLSRAPCGADCDTRMHRPRTTGEALICMEQKLRELYARGDRRAVFLRAYYVMTAQVNASIRGTGDFRKTGPIFFDPGWVDRLAGRFARLYFESLDSPVCAAWKMAEGCAQRTRSSVLKNMLLGINAHINFDLARGIHEVLQEEGDARDVELMARRKFDHDQMNNVLVRCNPKIQEVLGREFGGGMRLFSELLGKFDELLTSTGLRYYRDRVWCNVLGLLSAKTPKEYEKVRQRLDWESQQVAEFISDGSVLNNAVFFVDSLLSRVFRRSYKDRFRPELDGEIHATGRMDYRLQMPFS